MDCVEFAPSLLSGQPLGTALPSAVEPHQSVERMHIAILVVRPLQPIGTCRAKPCLAVSKWTLSKSVFREAACRACLGTLRARASAVATRPVDVHWSFGALRHLQADTRRLHQRCTCLLGRALPRWLQASSAKFKMIGSSVAWSSEPHWNVPMTPIQVPLGRQRCARMA